MVETVSTEETFKFYMKELVELLDTFEKETVEAKITELSEYSYGGTNLEEILSPVKDLIAQFDFMTAAETVSQLMEKGGGADV